MDDILNSILNSSYTTFQVNSRVRILKEYSINRLFASQEINFIEHNYKASDIAWLKSIDQTLLSHFTKDNVYANFKSLEEAIKKLPRLVVYIPFELPEEEMAHLGLWLRQNFQKIIVIDLKLDPNLIAGCALVWNGVYKDYSLRQRIMDERDDILENFKEMLHI